MKKKVLGTLLCTLVSASMLFGCASTKEQDQVNDQGQTDTPDTDTGSGTDETDTPDETDADEPGGDNADAPGASGDAKMIALAMPSESDKRWVQDAENMKKGLEAKGYAVDTQYAQDDAKKQASQIKSFIAAQADCIVVAAVDSKELTQVAQEAGNAGIPIIAYDRLLMDTDAVSYYVAFDHKGIGTAIGQAIAQKAGLEDLADDAYKTIEFFMGQPDDPNAEKLYDGLMEVIQPYLDTGKLVCKTERTSFAHTSVEDGSQETAQQRLESYLAGYYAEEELDICAAAFDGLAYGCKEALLKTGYTEANWPVISGESCEVAACKDILDGTQAFSIYKDTRILAERCVSMVEAAVNGTEAEITDTEQYDNGKMVVPVYLCAPSVVDKDNLQEVLVDSGYYTKEELYGAQ